MYLCRASSHLSLFIRIWSKYIAPITNNLPTYTQQSMKNTLTLSACPTNAHASTYRLLSTSHAAAIHPHTSLPTLCAPFFLVRRTQLFVCWQWTSCVQMNHWKTQEMAEIENEKRKNRRWGKSTKTTRGKKKRKRKDIATISSVDL